MDLIEELARKLKKWRPVRRKGLQNEVSVSRKGIDIFSWAAEHFEGYKEVDLYLNEEESSVGLKPTSSGQRRLAPKTDSRGFVVACAPMMRRMGVEERRRVPAQWSEKEGMLILDLSSSKT